VFWLSLGLSGEKAIVTPAALAYKLRFLKYCIGGEFTAMRR
jgi:hypothetical protein